jgi:hypothetical protein
VVTEEKIQMWKANRSRTPFDGKSSRCLWQGKLKKSIEEFFFFNCIFILITKVYWSFKVDTTNSLFQYSQNHGIHLGPECRKYQIYLVW